jgi:drug/metabolite transporter (DMT)-like permease
MGRGYRSSSSGAQIVRDSVYISARLPWWGAIGFGTALFVLFYFGIPAYLESKITEANGSMITQAFESLFIRRIHWFEWIGIACALIGAFFGIRNYMIHGRASHKEQGVIAFFYKLISQSID